MPGVYGTTVNLENFKESVVIDNTNFIDNANGVRMVNFLGSVITRSTFNLGLNYGDMNKCSTLYGSSFGVDLTGCSGFRIEENAFNGGTGGINYDFNGVRVFSCPSLADVIYKNTFSNLKRGNYAQGNNRIDDDDETGVSYVCNVNSLNKIDFHVKDDTSMIATYIGTRVIVNNFQRYIAAGNVLTNSSFSGLQAHFINENKDNEAINYYQWEANSSQILDLNKIFWSRVYP